MSYDVSLEVPTGPDSSAQAYWRNHTSNTSRMWREAGCDIAAFEGKKAEEFAPFLAAAIRDIASRRDHYRQYEPGNGWGTVDSTLAFLEDLHIACEEHPWALVRVSH